MSQWFPPWNSDCLNVVAVLAMNREGKTLKRLARRFNLLPKGSEPTIEEVVQLLHEACHRDADLVRTIEKGLDSRFGATVARVRSLEPHQVAELSMDWPAPLLWATLTDAREEVRRHGRLILHGMLWNLFRQPATGDSERAHLRRKVEALEKKVREKHAELVPARESLRARETEAAGLRSLLEKMSNGPASADPDKAGQGRLLRQVRKLQYELNGERERTEIFRRAIRSAGISVPEDIPSGTPAGDGCPDMRPCPCGNGHEGSRCTNRCCEGSELCPRCPLEGLRVAVIGGPDRMQPAYRRVVQQLGAEFLFHDGGVRNGSTRVKSLVCGADIVVFITTINSHGALNAVKAVCKKTGKKFVALRETGAESLGKTLRVIAA